MSKTAKQKGRLGQQEIRDALLEAFPELEPDDIKSTVMGDTGADIQLSPAARRRYNISVECKNQESLSVWKAYEQAQANCGKSEPVLFMKKNRKKALVVIDADYFISLL